MQFMPRRFSLPGLLAFEEAVARMMDEGHLVSVTFFDYTRAFESANQKILLTTLKSSGLGDAFSKWFETSFLDGSLVYTLVSRKAR